MHVFKGAESFSGLKSELAAIERLQMQARSNILIRNYTIIKAKERSFCSSSRAPAARSGTEGT